MIKYTKCDGNSELQYILYQLFMIEKEWMMGKKETF